MLSPNLSLQLVGVVVISTEQDSTYGTSANRFISCLIQDDVCKYLGLCQTSGPIQLLATPRFGLHFRVLLTCTFSITLHDRVKTLPVRYSCLPSR